MNAQQRKLRPLDYIEHMLEAMRGMRNRLAHGYFEINLDVVWDTVQQSLAELEKQLLDVLENTSSDLNGGAGP